MFGAQRLQKMRELILEQEIVDVTSLSKKFNVSEVTIRRDFDKLEKEGFIKKTYGGAILNKDYKSTKTDVPIINDLGEREEDIKLITEIALQMIQGDESIFLGGGPISRSIAANLADKKKLLVITNDVFVAAELCNNPDIKVTVTGGDLIVPSGLMVGPRALSTVEDIYVSKAFFDINAVDLKFGYSMESYDEVVIIREVMKMAGEAIALADQSKFDKISYTKLGDLGLFKKVISNKEIDDEYKKIYYSNNIKLFTTYDVS
jgi:DeoR family fructose operon transcriptional repressor